MDANEHLISDSSTGDPSISGPDLSGRRIVAALFATHPDARSAIDELNAAGFGEECIGVAVRRSEPRPIVDSRTPAAEAAGGAVSGGIVGGFVGAIIGVGLMAVPGAGWLAAGGALAAMFAGAGVGAVGGGLIGALTGMGLSRDEAESFGEGIESGRVLVTVTAPNDLKEAIAILERHGGDLGPLRIADSVPQNRAKML